MKKMVMAFGLAALVGTTGCQMWKEMQERQAAEAAAVEKEKAEKGPVRYWLEHNGSEQQVQKAMNSKAKDPDMREAHEYSVTSFISARESLVKVQVVQDGIAVWNRALAAQSEAAKKELKDFTDADNQAAYQAVVTAAQAADATEAAKKDLAALNGYFQWGRALEASAAAAARARNQAFVKALAKYTIMAKKLGEKYKKDKMKMAAAIADGMASLSWLSLAGEASGLEAEVMEAAKKASEHLNMVEAK